jgi:threonine/homoserine/homoserine lactone efflux protein
MTVKDWLQRRKDGTPMTRKDWIVLGVLLVLNWFVLSPALHWLLRWLGVPEDWGVYNLPPDVRMGLLTVICLGVLVWFAWHVRRERRSPRSSVNQQESR